MAIPALLFQSIRTAPPPFQHSVELEVSLHLKGKRPDLSNGKAVSPDVGCRDAQEVLD